MAQTLVQDNDMLMCKLVWNQRGSKAVIGPAIFDQKIAPNMRWTGKGWSFYYGYRSPDDPDPYFLVHRADVDLAPHWFKPVEDAASGLVHLPRRKAPTPPVPSRIRLGMKGAVESPADATKAMPPRPEAGPDGTQTTVEELLEAKGKRPFDPQLIPGITAPIAEQMLADGLKSKEDIAALGVKGLKKYRGIGETKAQIIYEALMASEEN